MTPRQFNRLLVAPEMIVVDLAESALIALDRALNVEHPLLDARPPARPSSCARRAATSRPAPRAATLSRCRQRHPAHQGKACTVDVVWMPPRAKDRRATGSIRPSLLLGAGAVLVQPGETPGQS